ncbi:hypothetical protein OG974_20885 [Streptomyces sp. NBC_00597]|uniref:hypothetical protein n=1 Tax=Streptomyces sp. NBC_00597 TaxID=2975786 RepID=UPI0030E5A44E
MNEKSGNGKEHEWDSVVERGGADETRSDMAEEPSGEEHEWVTGVVVMGSDVDSALVSDVLHQQGIDVESVYDVPRMAGQVSEVHVTLAELTAQIGQLAQAVEGLVNALKDARVRLEMGERE